MVPLGLPRMQLCKHMPLRWATHSGEWKLITSRRYGYSYKNLALQKLQCQKPFILTHIAEQLLAEYMYTGPLIPGLSPPKCLLYCKKVSSVGKKKSVYNLSVCICDPVMGHENLRAIEAFNINSKLHLTTIFSSKKVRKKFPQDPVNFITC